MKKVEVRLARNSYDIHIGSGLLRQTAQHLEGIGTNGKVVVITNPIVKGLYGDALHDSLSKKHFKVTILEVPDGEEQKSLDVAGSLYQELTNVYAERTTPILALGGGVIGDLAGFVAATYLRGVPLVQIPTTLLAQVDSSIGGKVGVNHGQLKNEIGAFYQPRLVIADIGTLKSLPANIFTEGLAEVIKYAIIWDKELFTFLEENLDKIKSLDDEVVEETVFRSAKIKAQVVEKDERELGLRSILNYGHTTGHAIESASDFKMRHGEAVAIGMVAAARISNKLGIFNKNELTRVKSLIERAGLPTEVPKLDVERIIKAISHDKKVLREKVRFILPKSIGDVFITDEVTSPLIEQVMVGYNEET